MTPRQRECSEQLTEDEHGNLICRACGWGGVKPTVRPTSHIFSFDHEWYLGGVRMLPGEYEVRRLGPAISSETPF